MMKIGISGSHRTGKTTLAKELAGRLRTSFVPSVAGEVFAAYGVLPSQTIDHSLRMKIQREILQRSAKAWKSTLSFVTDRTPLDFIAYTYESVIKGNNPDYTELSEYSEECMQVFTTMFTSVIIVQPGIAIVADDTKAVADLGYMERLNWLILSYLNGERCTHMNRLVLYRRVTDLDQRVEMAEGFVRGLLEV